MEADSTLAAGAARPIRVVVADDEAFNVERIARLLERDSAFSLVGSAADGDEAIERIRTLRPDLVFLDVQMPRKTGLEVVQAIGPDELPATIFVTAYSQYAVAAFELAAVDYLVKPFDDERFHQALARARRLVTVNDLVDLRSRLAELARSGDSVLAGGRAGTKRATYLERIAVEIRGLVRPVRVADIDYIAADGPYAELHVGDRRFVIREPLRTLEERLDPGRFMRIHRSVIVRLDFVDSMKRNAAGDGEVLLRNGIRLRVSRSRRESLERWFGLKP